ncbi:ankyrin repeat domain-containing protein [Parashewanella curva]|uniref:Ankyrin repeat domain-containing protein n=1 Tax=Parashewanella curva TaxID=2338552 RepID=A0A3L8Q1W7_9GAMM|nr:ankyrin repeat domain-containing protein [Parashewanella curva]RLV61584.1 ankyrin repeat domain-containing protein [Parashewanella curva]
MTRAALPLLDTHTQLPQHENIPSTQQSATVGAFQFDEKMESEQHVSDFHSTESQPVTQDEKVQSLSQLQYEAIESVEIIQELQVAMSNEKSCSPEMLIFNNCDASQVQRIFEEHGIEKIAQWRKPCITDSGLYYDRISPFLLYCSNGNLKIAMTLYSHGANVNETADCITYQASSQTPLTLALMNQQFEVALWLLTLPQTDISVLSRHPKKMDLEERTQALLGLKKPSTNSTTTFTYDAFTVFKSFISSKHELVKNDLPLLSLKRDILDKFANKGQQEAHGLLTVVDTAIKLRKAHLRLLKGGVYSEAFRVL